MRLHMYVALGLSSLLLAVLAGCSGSNSSLPITSITPVAVTPGSVSLAAGQTAQFTANAAVTWEVNNVVGGNTQVGTINANGLYTAPSNVQTSATMRITAATSNANTSSWGTATVIVNPPVSVSISPKNVPPVEAGSSQQFSAQVTNASDTSVTWQVNGIPGGGSSIGTISSMGLYTAPDPTLVPSDFSVMVTAVSNADPTKSDSATVKITIVGEVAVTVNPSPVSLIPGQTQLFSATVTPSIVSQAVTWSIDANASCQGSACGIIAPDGTYTAPANVPAQGLTVAIRATSVAVPTTSGTATATITLAPTPTVTISPAGPLTLGLSATQMFTATVNMDPSHQGVTWTLACIADEEGAGFEDCTNDLDGDNDTNSIVNLMPFSVQLNTAPTLGVPPAASFTLILKATSVAAGSGGSQGVATVTITVN